VRTAKDVDPRQEDDVNKKNRKDEATVTTVIAPQSTAEAIAKLLARDAKAKEYHARYNATHKEAIREYHRTYNANNKKELTEEQKAAQTAYHTKYNAEHREQVKKYHTEYNKARREALARAKEAAKLVEGAAAPDAGDIQ
jgi:hypothetical protein